jgi:2-polyprenyl-3-methyl-5-hydroxy-6-metoxy-1,4-benzoquinol methylase
MSDAPAPAADEYREFCCDLCGATDSVELPHSREFHRGQPIDICRQCGFVYVKQRRSSKRIAAVWSDEVFGHVYSAAIPAVTARLTFVAEFVDVNIGLSGKRVAEIGAGEGHFLQMIREPRYGAHVFGVEPSAKNSRGLSAAGIDHFTGTIEEYVGSSAAARQQLDLVSIVWTLENCQDCKAMLNGAYEILKPDGHIVVATGSRVLVPFKKPLHAYFSQNAADTHAFRFSANTLRALLAICGFETIHVNRYIDHDVLCMIARKTDRREPLPWSGDRPIDVYMFFERWYVDTKMYFPDPI